MNKYYAYIHTNGGLHIKVFFDDGDLKEANESPFVAKTIGPFLSRNPKEAREKALSLIFTENSKNIQDITKKF
jgi:hypothetical protein